MKVGSRVKVIELLNADKRNTDLKIGDTGVVIDVNAGSKLVAVRIDRDFMHNSCNYRVANDSYDFYDRQLEVISTNETVDDTEKITVTETDVSKAIAKAMADFAVKNPVGLLLADDLAKIGASILYTLFKEEN